MKSCRRVFILLLLALAPLAGWAQTPVSITSLPYSSGVIDFNGYNPTSQASLNTTIPAGWSASSAKASVYNGVRANPTNTTTGGYYAFGTSGDYALGALLTGTTGEITYSVSFTNNSGNTITKLTLGWDYKQFTYKNTSGWSITGTGALAGNTTLATKTFTGTATGPNGTVTTTNIPSFTLTGLAIASGDTFGISWMTTDDASSDNLVGIDNFSLDAAYVPPCTGPTLSATSFTSSAISTTGATLGWTFGNGANRVVFLREGAFGTMQPANYTTYTANSNFTGTSTTFDGGKTIYNSNGNAVAVTNLTPNTVYNAKVFEYLGATGVECYAATALNGSFTTVSNPVIAGTATFVSDVGFTANWTAPGGAAAVTYTLEVATDNAFSNIVQTISSISATSQSVAGLSASTSYYYRVKVVNAGGVSAASNVTTVSTLDPAPPQPTLAQTCGATTLNAYTGLNAATYYWQDTNAAGASTALPATASYTATASGTYYVRAFDNGRWSAAAAIPVTVVKNPVITAQPANVSSGVAGRTAVFSVIAADAGSYQWQENTGSGWTSITNGGAYAGATTATLTLQNLSLAMSGYQYRVLVGAASPCTGSLTSSSATLTVGPASVPTGYFRSRASGLYGAPASWESSVDSLNWMTATDAPTLAARSITVRATDSIAVAAAGLGAAHLYILGKLNMESQPLRIADSSSVDVVLTTGGTIYYGNNYFTLASGATVLLRTKSVSFSTGNEALENTAGKLATAYYYEDSAVAHLLINAGSFKTSDQTYFPTNTDQNVVPIFRVTVTGTSPILPGAGTPVVVNGLFELTGTVGITWQLTGAKVLRNGFINSAPMIFRGGPLQITGTKAVIGGTGLVKIAPSGVIASGAVATLLNNKTIDSSGALTVNGTLHTNGYVLAGAANFTTGTGSALVITDAAGITANGNSGNIQTTGTRTFSSDGQYIYRSAGAQVTGDGLPASSSSLEINNAAGVTLSAPHTVNNALRLTSGILTTTAAQLLTLGNATGITGGSALAYIDGPLRRLTSSTVPLPYPIGKAGKYAPVVIEPQTAAAGDYTAAYFNGKNTTPDLFNKDASVVFVAANEHFEISRAAGPDARITLSYTSDAHVTDPSSLVVAHYTGGQWVSEGSSASTGNNSGGTVASLGFVNSFSPFALGSTSINQPLPVRLLAFRLVPKEGAAHLEWELAATDGSEQVIVERSADGRDFTPIGIQKATQAERLSQSHIDSQPLPGVSYYRLRILSATGAASFSPTLSARFGELAGGWRLFPNPAKEALHLEWADAATPVRLRLYNATGQLAHAETVAGRNHTQVAVRHLADGLYWLMAEQNGRVERYPVHVRQ